MITKDDFAEAARYADAQAEELGSLAAYCEQKGIDLRGLIYIGQQRALRVAMLRDGKDPTRLPRDRLSHVSLSDASQDETIWLFMAIVDGIAIGLAVER